MTGRRRTPYDVPSVHLLNTPQDDIQGTLLRIIPQPGPLGFVTARLDAQRVLRFFCYGTEGLGKEVSVDSDSVRHRERFVLATARFTTQPCVRYRERRSIILMLILMLRAKHTDAKRLIWARNLKSRDRPRLKQSTVERLSPSISIQQSCTAWLRVPLSMNDSTASETAPLGNSNQPCSD